MAASRRPRAGPAPAPADALEEGLVVACHGRHCVVESPGGERRICHPRGKKNQTVVGDRVLWCASGDEGAVHSVHPRRNLFYRQDEVRTKSFAANLDQVLILLAAEPEFSQHQLARALIAAEAQEIAPLIVLNKRDLAQSFAAAWERLSDCRRMGYSVLGLALNGTDDAWREMLGPRLEGKTTLVLGPSGAGKSTLINALAPGAAAQTGALSQALNAGRHTTTTTTWYWVDPARRTALIDSPGFQEFGLQHLGATQLAHLMPDIARHAGGCRFYNCTHLHEPGCAVRAQVQADGGGACISALRYRIYCDLFQELSAPTRY